MTKAFIIAIDGTAASGKGTLSKALAKQIGFEYLDTGLLYRIAAYNLMKSSIDIADPHKIVTHLKTVHFTGYESINLHVDEVGNIASKIAPFAEVREFLNKLQLEFPLGKNGVVIDGRDIGTVVFPSADLKFFITADLEIRADRRYKQLKSSGKDVIFADVLRDLRERDERDIHRKVAPTVAAIDAIIIDTTHLEAAAVLELALALSQKAIRLLAA
jgi:CMP/dCMP kinase